MKRWVAVLAIASSLALPLGAGAQPQGDPGRNGPPPEMRATMLRLAAEARRSALEALSPGNRARVRAIVAQTETHALDMRAAAKRIDDLLSPHERAAVLAAAARMRDGMRAAGAPPPPEGGPPGGGPPGGGPPPGGPPGGEAPGGGSPRIGGRTPDPGRFLLMVSRTERFHGPEPRSNGAQ
jgi:hypothetical protein